MSDENKEQLESIHCATCGVSFGIDKAVTKLWRESHKDFWCPNGHSLAFRGETPNEKELKTLRTKVQALETELSSTKEELAKQNKRVEELTAELEIWKPSDKVA